MKIALFSDIHGNLEALEAIMNSIKEDRIEKIICLGDVIGLGPNSKECLDIIINHDITMLLGNHELYYLHGLEIDNKINDQEVEHHKYVREQLYGYHYTFLEKCPINLTINYKNNILKFAHFLIEDINKVLPYYPISILKENYDDILLKNPADYIFIGHKHLPFKKTVGDINLIDIGSSGCKKNNITSYYLIELIHGKVFVEEKTLTYNRETFENKMIEADYPEKVFINKVFFGVENI